MDTTLLIASKTTRQTHRTVTCSASPNTTLHIGSVATPIPTHRAELRNTIHPAMTTRLAAANSFNARTKSTPKTTVMPLPPVNLR